MQKYLLILLLFPCSLAAQKQAPVTPIESDDYLFLIRGDSAYSGDSSRKRFPVNKNVKWYELKREYSFLLQYNKIANISIANNKLILYPLKEKRIGISGTFNTSLEAHKANRQAIVQKQYAQGRKVNGQPQWQGAETNEEFSFGPLIQTLEFDGSNYPYDKYGRLVSAGMGNNQPAIAYNNSLIRTGFTKSQTLNIQSNYYENNVVKLNTGIILGNMNNVSILNMNKNSSQHLGLNFQSKLYPISISGAYQYLQHNYSNSNRNGFLNRVYQQALLTPVSFQNAQGYWIGSAQRRYSLSADNPEFLLNDPANLLKTNEHSGSLNIKKTLEYFTFTLDQKLQHSDEISKENYQAGSAGFPAGRFTRRHQTDRRYSLQAIVQYTWWHSTNYFKSDASISYSLNSTATHINYQPQLTRYRYNRNAQETDFSYALSYRSRGEINAGLHLGNKFYVSSTTSKNEYFLPRISGYVEHQGIAQSLRVKISSSFMRFNSELPLKSSFAQTILLNNSVSEASSFFPISEAVSFNNLLPVKTSEWTLNTDIFYQNRLSLTVAFFSRLNEDDVFPLLENDQIVLRNLVSHSTKGMDISLSLLNGRYSSTHFQFYGSISLSAWRSKITSIKDGYNNTPVAGFSDIHKILTTGQPLGAIAGSAYLRDAAGNRIIGADGFPLVDNNPKIVANPIPDFVAKFNNNIDFKHWRLSVDWEWRKGGQAWNGTQALLDYYGRSASSAKQRHTSDYIFHGVTESGHPNNIPVDFYDNSMSVYENRWTRYGQAGIAEEYVQSTDQLRITSLMLSHTIEIKKPIRELTISTYISNLVIWSAYKGVDPGIRSLFDQTSSNGLDYFNLPAVKSFGIKAHIKF